MIVGTSLLITDGGTASRVNLEPLSIDGTTNAKFQIANDGIAYQIINSTAFEAYDWKISGSLSDYEVYASNSGDSVAGTLNTWLPTTSSYTWSLASPSGFVKSSTLTVKIRDKNTLTELDSAQISLAANNI